MAGWIFIAIGVVTVVCFALFSTRREQRLHDLFEKRRAERLDQTVEEFAAECELRAPSEVVERVRRVLARVSDFSYSANEHTTAPARLRASDDICADLGYEFDSLSFAQLYMELEKEFGIHLVFDEHLLGLKAGGPLTVAKLTRVIVTEIQQPKPELDESFQPGFRISKIDCVVLAIGAVGSVAAWQYFVWLGYSIACVVGHFFLFCNVVRMSRGLELAWSAVFLMLTAIAIFGNEPYWWAVAITGTGTMTIGCVALAMLKRSYHGAYWRNINPRLPQWWAASRRKVNE